MTDIFRPHTETEKEKADGCALFVVVVFIALIVEYIFLSLDHRIDKLEKVSQTPPSAIDQP